MSTRFASRSDRPDLVALGAKERERHPAADQEPVDLAEERLDERELVGDLRPAEDRDERARRRVEDPRERGELLLHEEPRHRRPEVPRDALRRGVGPVGGGERVVHVDVAEPRERLGERGVVRLLARVEAEVLEEQQAAPAAARRPGARRPARRSPARAGPSRRGAPPRRRAIGARENFGSGPPFGPAEVGRDDHRARARAPARGGGSGGPRGSARPRSPRRRARAGR